MSELITDDEVICNLRMALDSAETRIRELEEQLDQEIRLYARCRERGAKAKAILESGREESSSGSLWESIVAALVALEGK